MTKTPFVIQRGSQKVEFSLDLDPNDENDRWYVKWCREAGCYEPEVTHVIMRALKPGDTAVDVGANIGFFSALMRQLVGPTGEVVAFEPDPSNGSKFLVNLAGSPNVTLIDAPVWRESTDRAFYFNVDSSGGSALWDPGLWHENPKTREYGSCTVLKTATLDRECQHCEKIRLIKMDTEGADYAVMEGAANILKTCKPPYVISEINPFGQKQLGFTTSEYRILMANFDYDLFVLHSDGSLPSLMPWNSELRCYNDTAVQNVLFSTVEAVGELWPEVPHEC